MGVSMVARAAGAAGLVLLLGASTAEAQNYKFELGVNGGGNFFTASLDENHLAGDDAVEFQPGFQLGAHAGLWFSPRMGLRANFAWSPKDVYDDEDVLPGSTFSPPLTIPDENDNVHLWTMTGDLLFRLKAPNAMWEGTEVLPYLALGAGVVRTDPRNLTHAANFPGAPGEAAEDGIVIGTDVRADGTPGRAFLLGDETRWTGLLGLGADIRFSPNWALKLEVNDRLWDPAFFALDPDAPGNLAEPNDEDIGQITHWISGIAGLSLLLGLDQVERQVVVAPPPPAPPAAPVERAPAAPRVDQVTVCVIDPSAAGGLRTVNAFFRHNQRDTVVVQMGDTVAINRTLPNVTLAPSASWYVQGQPLVFEFDRAPRRAEFATYGTSRVISASDLTFIGYQGGVPLYVARGDVSEVQEQWDELVRAEAEGDLDDIIEQRSELRNAFNDMDVLYVPVQPYNCVFQALQRQEEVRKGGK